MARTVLKSALAVALLLALLQLAYWLGVRRYFDNLAAAVAPAAQLRYERVVAWPDGSLGVDGLSFAPAGQDQRLITAERLRVERGDLGWLLRWLAGIAPALPQRLSVRLEGVQASASLLRQLRRGSGLVGLVVPFEGVACGDAEPALSDADYAALKWTDQRADVLLQFDYDRHQRHLRVGMRIDRAPLGVVRTSIDLRDVPESGVPFAADLGGARLDRVELVYEEQGALAQRNQYCAQIADAAPAAWTERHLERLHGRLREHGLVPDEPVWSAYVHWLSTGGPVRLTAAPAPGVPLTEYAAFAPEDRLRLLGLKMHLNGDAVVPVEATGIAARDAAFRALPPLPEPSPGSEDVAVLELADDADLDDDTTFGVDADPSIADETVADMATEAAAPAPAPSSRPRLVVITQPIEFADLDSYRGQRVRIRTVSGGRHVGIVLAATADAVDLEIRRYGGGARLPIQREQINRIEVLRRELRSDG